jgi:hypothetical protein
MLSGRSNQRVVSFWKPCFDSHLMLTNNNSKLGQILNCVPSEPGKSEKKILLFVQNQLKDLTGQQDLLLNY